MQSWKYIFNLIMIYLLKIIVLFWNKALCSISNFSLKLSMCVYWNISVQSVSFLLQMDLDGLLMHRQGFNVCFIYKTAPSTNHWLSHWVVVTFQQLMTHCICVYRRYRAQKQQSLKGSKFMVQIHKSYHT